MPLTEIKNWWVKADPNGNTIAICDSCMRGEREPWNRITKTSWHSATMTPNITDDIALAKWIANFGVEGRSKGTPSTKKIKTEIHEALVKYTPNPDLKKRPKPLKQLSENTKN